MFSSWWIALCELSQIRLAKLNLLVSYQTNFGAPGRRNGFHSRKRPGPHAPKLMAAFGMDRFHDASATFRTETPERWHRRCWQVGAVGMEEDAKCFRRKHQRCSCSGWRPRTIPVHLQARCGRRDTTAASGSFCRRRRPHPPAVEKLPSVAPLSPPSEGKLTAT